MCFWANISSSTYIHCCYLQRQWQKNDNPKRDYPSTHVLTHTHTHTRWKAALPLLSLRVGNKSTGPNSPYSLKEFRSKTNERSIIINHVLFFCILHKNQGYCNILVVFLTLFGVSWGRRHLLLMFEESKRSRPERTKPKILTEIQNACVGWASKTQPAIKRKNKPKLTVFWLKECLWWMKPQWNF